MIRRQQDVLNERAQPTTAMVRALVAMAEMDGLETKRWISVDDLGYMTQKLFGLSDEDTISAAFVSRQLRADASLKGWVLEMNELGSNGTGIFRWKHKNKQHLFLCKPGETPPHRSTWNEIVKKVERPWVPPPLNGFDDLKEELKASVIGTNSVESKKNSGDNKRPPIKSTPRDSTQTSTAAKKPATTYHHIRILIRDDTVVNLKIDEALAKQLLEKMKQQITASQNGDSNVFWPQAKEVTPHCVFSEAADGNFETPAPLDPPRTTADIAATEINDVQQSTKRRSEEGESSNNRSSEPKRMRHVNYVPCAIKVNGEQHVVENVPTNYDVVLKCQTSRMKNAEAKLNTIVKELNNKRYNGKELSKRMYGMVMSLCAGLSYTAAETFVPVVVAAFMANTKDEDKRGSEKGQDWSKGEPSERI